MMDQVIGVLRRHLEEAIEKDMNHVIIRHRTRLLETAEREAIFLKHLPERKP